MVLSSSSIVCYRRVEQLFYCVVRCYFVCLVVLVCSLYAASYLNGFDDRLYCVALESVISESSWLIQQQPEQSNLYSCMYALLAADMLD